ncbi:hypothetical protein [Bradyrhizobium sp. RDM4]|uniref:hypothetical protein n=1 Tax=Bradyrhizobium sp. RDM4 TaxID=3378765 RepID=UPI0038FC63BA
MAGIRKILLRGLLVLSALLPIKSAMAVGWELVFSDEFNGNQLDRNRWATRFLYSNETMDHFNDEKQRYGDNHVLSDGVLSLVAKKRKDPICSSRQ